MKFIKDLAIIYKANDCLYTAGRHLRLGWTAFELQAEVLDGRWAVTDGVLWQG